MQDYPNNATLRRKAAAAVVAGANQLGASRDSANTSDGALGFKFATCCTMLVTCRPAGTTKYSADEQVQRAATIAAGPDSFLALWNDLVASSTAAPAREAGLDCDASDDASNELTDDQIAKKVCYYANRSEWAKAWSACGPRLAVADGRCPEVQSICAKLTPQSKPPRAEVMADEPGTEPRQIKRKSFEQVAKRFPRCRKGGPSVISYETLALIYECGGADGLFNFCASFGRGAIHDDLTTFNTDLTEVLFWKNEDCTDCRPLGMCDIWFRCAERCVGVDISATMNKYCTSMLPEDQEVFDAELQS